MACDDCQPASSDPAPEHLDAKSISDTERARMAEARILEVSSALEEKTLELFAAEAQIHSHDRKIRGLENTIKELSHLKQLVPELKAELKKVSVDAEAKGKRLDQQDTYITGILRDLLRAEEKIEIAQGQAKGWKNVAKQSTKEKLTAEVSAPILRKRKATSSSTSEPVSKKPKNPRYTPCSKCFVNNRECDANPDACKQCTMRSQGRDCKRVKCKYFAAGTCRNKKCKFAHEEDRFHRLIGYMKLKRHRTAGEEISAQDNKMLEMSENAVDVLDLLSDVFDLGDKKQSGKAEGGDNVDGDDGVNGVPV